MILDTGYADLAPFLHAGYEVKAHPTLLLDCRRPVDDLWGGLRDKVRNVIRRARERLTVCDIDDLGLFVRFYEMNLEGEDPYFDLSLLAAVIAAARARGQCKIVAAIDESLTTHAMVVFIWDDRYVYYFLSSRERNVAHVGAISLLLWTGIELAHTRGVCMDFDGGIIKDSRYKFLISFGGELANRFEVVRSTPGYRFQNAIRRVPRAIVRRLSTLAKPPAKAGILLGLCCAHLIQACCGRAASAIEMVECLV